MRLSGPREQAFGFPGISVYTALFGNTVPMTRGDFLSAADGNRLKYEG